MVAETKDFNKKIGLYSSFFDRQVRLRTVGHFIWIFTMPYSLSDTVKSVKQETQAGRI